MVRLPRVAQPPSHPRRPCSGTLPSVTDIQRPALEGTVAVRDGRRLSFAEYGSPRGAAIIWMHGTPGARRQIPLEARRYADEHGLRIIGVDRPGHRLVDAVPLRPDRRLDRRPRAAPRRAGDRHLPADRPVRRRPLRARRGRQPARARARRRRPRRRRPHPRPGRDRRRHWSSSRSGSPRCSRSPGSRSGSRSPRASGWSGRWPAPRSTCTPPSSRPATRTCCRGPSSRRCSSTTCSTASRFQTSAPLNDLLLFTRDWGFTAADVTVPVRWWHGDEDHIVPFRHGQHLVARLPDATLTSDRRREPPRRARHRRGVISTLMELGPAGPGSAGPSQAPDPSHASRTGRRSVWTGTICPTGCWCTAVPCVTMAAQLHDCRSYDVRSSESSPLGKA